MTICPRARPGPPCPRTCPRRPHTCPRTRARSPRAAAAPRGSGSFGCRLPSPAPGRRMGDGDGDKPQRGRDRCGGEQSCAALVSAWPCWLCHLSPCRLCVPRACVTPKDHVTFVPHVVPGACVLRSAHRALVLMSLACSHATLLMPTSPQYVTWCPHWCLCHLGASVVQVLVPPCCFYDPSTSPTSVHGHSDPFAPLCPCHPSVPRAKPVSKACHLSRQCAPTAAPGTCTRCGARPAAWLRPPSACSPPNWCWCWVSDPPRWGQPPLSPPAGTAGSATPRCGSEHCAGRGHMH